MAQSRVTLPGSERPAIANATPVPGANAQPDPQQRINVTVLVRRKADIPSEVVHSGGLSKEEVSAQFGATEDDLNSVAEFAKQHNLQVDSQSAVTRTVELSGTIADMEKAFDTSLNHVQVDSSIFRQRTGSICLPADVAPVITGVFGLDNRPAAQPRFRRVPESAAKPNAAEAFSPVQVADLYHFPTGTGVGETVAIIELGGGFAPADLKTYFGGLNLPEPKVTAVPTAGGTNSPGTDPNADGEVMLDIEVAGAVAPDASIKVYFCPNTDQGFLAGINAAIHDTPTPTVISISWGGPESSWTAQATTAFDEAFQNAAALNTPVLIASGDSGSTDGTGSLEVDFPASSPHATGCGGTHMEGSGTKITKEHTWNSYGNASGGGISTVFAKPSYQDQANIPQGASGNVGRGVPDISGDAAPETGYNVRVDGQDTVIGGTSAVAPLWAGLIARIAQNLGRRLPFLNPVLYANPGALHDIRHGNNIVDNSVDEYKAGKGWDACTGLGTPNGPAILSAFKSAGAASSEQNVQDESIGNVEHAGHSKHDGHAAHQEHTEHTGHAEHSEPAKAYSA